MARPMKVTVGEVRRAVPRGLAKSAGLAPDHLLRIDPKDQDRVDVMVPEQWVETPIGDTGWVAAALLVPHQGAPVVAELRIYPREDALDWPAGVWSGTVRGVQAQVSGAITARLLRRVPLGRFVRASEELARFLVQAFGREVLTAAPSPLTRVGLPAPSEPRRQRRRVADFAVAGIAAEYAERVSAGSRRVLVDLHEQVWPKIPVKRLVALVSEARRRGLLTKPRAQGTPGGRLTEKARTLLGKSYIEPSPPAAVGLARPPRKKGGGSTRRTDVKRGALRRSTWPETWPASASKPRKSASRPAKAKLKTPR